MASHRIEPTSSSEAAIASHRRGIAQPGIGSSRLTANRRLNARSQPIGTAEFEAGRVDRILQGPVVITGSRTCGATRQVPLDFHGLRQVELAIDVAVQPILRFFTVHLSAPRFWRGQALFQLLAAPGQPRHHCAQRNLGHRGHFFVRQSLKLAQNNHLAKFDRQFFQCLADQLSVGLALQALSEDSWRHTRRCAALRRTKSLSRHVCDSSAARCCRCGGQSSAATRGRCHPGIPERI